jgi:hydrogenase expression/formation protein HypE
MDQDRKRIAVGEDSMRIGKLSNQELEEIVLSKLPPLSSKTITGAGIGADCAWLDFGDNTLVTSTDPVTAGGMQSGRIAIHVSCMILQPAV